MNRSSDSLIQKTDRLVLGARVRLVWETYAPVLAPAMLAIALFVPGAWLAVWEWLGDPWRLIALLATLVVSVRSLLSAIRLPWPSRSDARRRVELDSGQSHRPLDVLDDRPVLSETAWPAHLQRAESQAKALRPATPQPALSRVDPYYLRFVLPALL